MSFKDFKKNEPAKAKEPIEEVKEDISEEIEEVSEDVEETKEDSTDVEETKEVSDPVEDILVESIQKVEEVEKTEEAKDEPKVQKYTVIVDILNVRKAPGADIIKQIHSGDVIEGEPENSEWIKLSNNEGFVMSKFVAPKKG